MTVTVPTEEQTRVRVRGALEPLLGEPLAAVADDDDLARALGDRYDSLTALECVSRVEAEFDIEVDFVEHDVRHVFATLSRIGAFVQEQLEDRAVLGGAG